MTIDIEKFKRLYLKKYGREFGLSDSALERVLYRAEEGDPDDYVLRDMEREYRRSFQGGH